MSKRVSFATIRGNAPENYERYFLPVIGSPLAADLVNAAGPGPGDRVLDLACGTGVVARLVADRIGDSGAIAGVDVNPDMLAVARDVTPAGVAMEWHQASAERLPLPDHAFDVVLCSLGVQFFSDRPATLREVRRVLTTGGRFVFNLPGPTPPLFAGLEHALARHLGDPAAAFVRLVFSLHDPDEIRRLLSDAGFHGIDVTTSSKPLRLPAPDDFLWQYIHCTPLAAAAAQLDEQGRERLQRDVLAAWQPLAVDGSLPVQLDVTIATARA